MSNSIAKSPKSKKSKSTSKGFVNKSQAYGNTGTFVSQKDYIYSRITEKVIAQMEKGIVPWRKPWKTLLDGSVEVPRNYATKKAYKGVNYMLLACNEHVRPYYMTLNQANEMGGRVRKGAKGEIILFYKFDTKDENGDEKKIFFEKISCVFNIADIDGIDFKLPELGVKVVSPEDNKIQFCEKIVAGYREGPRLVFSNPEQAYYSPSKDTVNMPRLEAFRSQEDYYKVLYHELIHSSGHSNRLNRKELMSHNGMGTKSYAKEELTAEMGANFLSSYCGFNLEDDSDFLTNTATYIAGYLAIFKNNKDVFYDAARQAQRAVTHILGEVEAQ